MNKRRKNLHYAAMRSVLSEHGISNHPNHVDKTISGIVKTVAEFLGRTYQTKPGEFQDLKEFYTSIIQEKLNQGKKIIPFREGLQRKLENAITPRISQLVLTLSEMNQNLYNPRPISPR